MTTFDGREQAFEAKFAHDEELAFRVTARRDKLVARWLGTWLGMDDAAQAALTNAILAIPNTAPHDARLQLLVEKTADAHRRPVPKGEYPERLRAASLQSKAELLDGPGPV